MKNDMKCKECGCTTKQKTGLCFTCEGIVAILQGFEKAISERQPLLGGKRKLEILGYRITKP